MSHQLHKLHLVAHFGGCHYEELLFSSLFVPRLLWHVSLGTGALHSHSPKGIGRDHREVSAPFWHTHLWTEFCIVHGLAQLSTNA